MQYTEQHEIPGLLVLIDLEKAFDSIYGKYRIHCAKFLGFGTSILKWIKMFNYDSKAIIVQCGITSEFLDIERGCRQGDSISSYEFILCAQILYLIITCKKQVKGIKIENKYMRHSLLEKKESLLAALNTLEIFGDLSLLQVNTNKTKLIWIGKKKFKG